MKNPLLVYANARGEVMNHDQLNPTGRTGEYLTDVEPNDVPFASPQTRLNFRPSADELADVMLTQPLQRVLKASRLWRR